VAKRPTLATVADTAGVSRQTVSNVLNNPEIVKPETLNRVQQVIAELGYRPSPVARQLRTQESRVIGLRIPPAVDGINGSVLDGFLHSLTESLQQHRYRVMLFAGDDSTAEAEQYAEMLDLLNLDGFVITSTHAGDPRIKWLTEHNVPFVSFGRPWGLIHQQNNYAATKDLLLQGHTRIAFVGWPEDSETGNERRAGWLDAMRESDQTFAEAAMTYAGTDGQSSGERAYVMLQREKPTAFICASDSLALGVYGAAIKVDDHPAIIGFDNTPVAKALGISSIEQNIGTAAHEITEMLLKQLNAQEIGDPVLITPHVEHRATSHHNQR
jgi:DNA-binding LacI/PurR family transcriptional regulator